MYVVIPYVCNVKTSAGFFFFLKIASQIKIKKEKKKKRLRLVEALQ